MVVVGCFELIFDNDFPCATFFLGQYVHIESADFGLGLEQLYRDPQSLPKWFRFSSWDNHLVNEVASCSQTSRRSTFLSFPKLLSISDDRTALSLRRATYLEEVVMTYPRTIFLV
jgi:hypothetical protein